MTDWQAICRNSSEDALLKIFGGNSFPLEAVYSAGAELTRREEAKFVICTNLYKWRKELAEGKRDVYTFDDLWRKACEETNEMELRSALSRNAGFTDPSTQWGCLEGEDYER